MAKDENELKNLLEHSEVINSYLDTIKHMYNRNHHNNNNNITNNNNASLLLDDFDLDNRKEIQSLFIKTKEKFMNLKIKYKDALQYPFDIIFEYISYIYDSFEKKSEKEKILETIDNVKYNNKIYLFFNNSFKMLRIEFL